MTIAYEDLAELEGFPDTLEEGFDYSKYYEMSNKVDEQRDSTFEFIDSYLYEPQKVDSLSSYVNDLLDPNSAYIQDARTRADEAATKAGFLQSGMAAGRGEADAIDRVVDTAYGNMRADLYNAYEEGQSSLLEYNAAREAGMASYNQQYELNSKDLFADFYDQFKDQDKKYQDAQNYAKFLMDSATIHNRYREAFDIHQFETANKRIETQMSSDVSEMFWYNEAYQRVMNSDIAQEDKWARVNSLVSLMGEYQDGKLNIKVPQSPYQVPDRINYQPKAPEYGSQFYWDLEDAKVEWSQFEDVVSQIDAAIHDQTSRAERSQYDAYKWLEGIRDKFPLLPDYAPDIFSNIMNWYDRIGKHEVTDNWDEVLYSMYHMMYSGFIVKGMDVDIAVSNLGSVNFTYDKEGEKNGYEGLVSRYDPLLKRVVYDFIQAEGRWGNYTPQIYKDVDPNNYEGFTKGLGVLGFEEYDPTQDNKDYTYDQAAMNTLGVNAANALVASYPPEVYQPVLDMYTDFNVASMTPEQLEVTKEYVSIIATNILYNQDPAKYYGYLQYFPNSSQLYINVKGLGDGSYTVYDSWTYSTETSFVNTRMIADANGFLVSEVDMLGALHNICLTEKASNYLTQCPQYDSIEAWNLGENIQKDSSNESEFFGGG